jgi:hypothetical protein
MRKQEGSINMETRREIVDWIQLAHDSIYEQALVISLS